MVEEALLQSTVLQTEQPPSSYKQLCRLANDCHSCACDCWYSTLEEGVGRATGPSPESLATPLKQLEAILS